MLLRNDCQANPPCRGLARALARWLVVMAAGGLVAACQSAPTRDPDFAAVRPPLPSTVPATPGAVYRHGHDLVLFEDVKARRVGDILTVNLVEQTDANKTAETDHTKDSTSAIDNPTLLGAQVQFNTPPIWPLSFHNDNTLQTRLSSGTDFAGDSESSQSNSLSGSISVTVAEVLPNGNLVVQGEKLYTLNQGHEHIRFSGIVRAVDIDTANSVDSTKVADARIIYAGEGPANDTNSMGWLTRFFVSAIFPF